MSVTASALMLELSPMLQEYGWGRNGFWSSPEIIGYINTVCKDFTLRSQIVKVTAPVPAQDRVRLNSAPPIAMQVDRITFGNRPLYSTNRTLLDREKPNWKNLNGIPKQFHQDQLPTRTFETDRAPIDTMVGAGYEAELPEMGRMGALREMSGNFGYTAVLPAAGRGGIFRYSHGVVAYNSTLLGGRGRGGVLRSMYDGQTNFAVVATRLPDEITDGTDPLTVPDFCKLYIKYGVLKKMLEKEGEGQDLIRAKYCGARYDRGIALFRRLIYGPVATDQKMGV